MSALGSSSREKNFINHFYKKELSERDLCNFSIEKMKASKINRIFRRSLEERELRTLYREVGEYRLCLDLFQDKKSIQQCNKNMQKLAALAWSTVDDVPSFRIDGSGVVGSRLSEEEILKRGGFLEEEIFEIATVLKDFPRVETVSVAKPKELTQTEQKKIKEKEKKGVKVFACPSLPIVVNNRANMSLDQIDQKTKGDLLRGPVRQIAKDFERDLCINVHTNEGLRSFDPKGELGRDLISKEEADKASLEVMHYIETLPGLTVGERVFVLANSEQNIYGEAGHAFLFGIFPAIQAVLKSKNPKGSFIATFGDKSALVHDVRKKRTTFSQVVKVCDLNLLKEEVGSTPPVILEFKLKATLDWRIEEMTLDCARLIFADAEPLK